MEKIKVLDKSIANKIAAGEVVERPASVIKELVENSIDAGADMITVEIQEGGKSYIRVADNGCGMTKNDAKMCFVRHATSKIHDVDDLFEISTLGFRGEAMASIAAVARVTLKTHCKDDSFGTSIIIDGGNMKSVEPCGCPDGTIVEVSDLFFNVPARLKFLKSQKVEGSAVSDYISRMILARPDIKFKFINNGSVIYQSSGDGILKNAIYSIYGAEVLPHLREVYYNDDHIEISGFIGTQEISRPNRTYQSLFVNGRYIKSLKLSSVLLSAYDTRIMAGRFPFAVLSFRLDYDKVDVNVHPNKLEVKFADEQQVVNALLQAARAALEGNTVPVYRFEEQTEVSKDKEEQPPVSQEVRDKLFKELMSRASFNSAGDFTGESRDLSVTATAEKENDADEQKPDAPPVQIPFFPAIEEAEEVDSPEADLKTEPQTKEQVEFGISPYRIIGCAFDSFWIIQQGETLFIIDQHAAHERLLYEKAIRGELKASSQILFVPIIIKLTSEEYDIYSDNKALFEEFGFIIEEFGMLTLRITAVPYILKKAEDASFFKDAIDRLSKHKNVTLIDMKREALISASCKGAIKLGNTITEDMIKSILDDYKENGIPLTCPHGRPVMIAITEKDLLKRFKRIL